MLWEKIANIKYTESTDTLSPSDAFFHTVDVLHWGYSWGLLLFVQAPDVNKEETRRRRLIHKTHTHTHTTEQNTWEKWPEGGSTAPQNTSWADRGRGKNRRKGDYDNCLFEVQYTAGCRGHAGPPSTADISAGQEPGETRWRGGDQ